VCPPHDQKSELAPLSLLFLPHRAELDPELLTFLVEMTALEAKGSRGVGDVRMIALQFTENHFAFKTLHAIRK